MLPQHVAQQLVQTEQQQLLLRTAKSPNRLLSRLSRALAVHGVRAARPFSMDGLSEGCSAPPPTSFLNATGVGHFVESEHDSPGEPETPLAVHFPLAGTARDRTCPAGPASPPASGTALSHVLSHADSETGTVSEHSVDGCAAAKTIDGAERSCLVPYTPTIAYKQWHPAVSVLFAVSCIPRKVTSRTCIHNKLAEHYRRVL
jgi:hypothetical protein